MNPPAPPPRLTHNRKLADAYVAEHPMFTGWPKITDQVETVPLHREKLLEFGYNASIIDHDGSIFMCYRYHEPGMIPSKLAGARILEDGTVESNWTVTKEGFSLEDPRLFKLSNGQIWVSWVESYYPIKPIGSIRLGCFKGDRIEETARPEYGKNDGEHMEKNWVWFEHRDAIHFIYSSHPNQVIVQWSGQLEKEYVTAGPRWPYGEIKGGTTPILHEGKLLRFFHSTYETEITWPKRRYVVGACLMNPEPPFEVVAVSRKPILWGSEHDNLEPDQQTACLQYKKKVVFPCGAISRPWGWLLSVGVNDSEIAICKITPEMLHLA